MTLENVVISYHFLFKCLLSTNTVHSPFNKNKENTCEDTGAWCAFLEQFCEHNDVQGQCRKTCHKCNGKYKINIYIIQVITIAFSICE